MKSWLRGAVTTFGFIFALLTAFNAWMYYTSYWVYKDCFGSQGSCFDSALDITVTDTTFVYGFIAVFFGVLSVATFVIARWLGK